MARTALHASAGFDDVDDLRQDIAQGLDLDEPDGVGFTPSHHACVHGRYDATKVLLEAGAEIDTENRWGAAPLTRAVCGCDGTVELGQLLIDRGADPTIENENSINAPKLAPSSHEAVFLAILRNAIPEGRKGAAWRHRGGAELHRIWPSTTHVQSVDAMIADRGY